MALRVGQRVRIDHPFYGEREVVVTEVDEPKNEGGLICYDCVIDGNATWFDENMIL